MAKAIDSFPKRWHSPRRTFRGGNRGIRWLRITIALGVVIGALRFFDKCHMHRAAMAIKYTPTAFPRLNARERAVLEDLHWQWDTDREGGFDRKDFLDHRDEWEKLGGGFEGEVFRYGSSVGKVFRQENAPFRNCVPGYAPDLRWPTEISASLILGGIGNSIGQNTSFLPVTDYFLAPRTETQPSKWHFLTPHLPLGSLTKLANHLRKSKQYTAHELDVLFRPSFDRLLQALDDMHITHDLCHDDVKLDNIFLAANGTQWLLGDLGNVRERGHAYHSSLLWMGRNLADCRANDVLRLGKVYMQFLRRAVGDVGLFDKEFFEGSQPWSRLFWAIWDDVREEGDGVAALAFARSSTYEPMIQVVRDGVLREPSEMRSPLKLFVGERWILKTAAKRILRVGTSEEVARTWGLVPLLGVPYPGCHTETS